MIPLLSLKQFLRDVRSQKLRTFMTMFGILWGTTAIVLLISFGTGIQKKQISQAKGLGDNIAIMWASRTSLPWNGLPRGRWVPFNEEDIAGMKATIPEIGRISPEFRRHNVRLKTEKHNMLSRISGIWPEFGDMRNLIADAGGRFINAYDNSYKRRVVFIGDRIAEDMFGKVDPIGQTMLMNRVPFTVVGILKPKTQNSSYGGRDSRMCFVPASTFQSMYNHRYPENLVVQAAEVNDMPIVKQEIRKFMARRRNFNPEDTEALSIWDTSEGMRFWNTLFLAFKIFLIGVGCLTLITGGIGVTNIMNVVLEERTKEIGIKMALGAKKRNILLQFMLETFMLTITGGILGFLAAFAVIKLFPLLNMSEEIGTPVIDIAGTMIAVSVLGLVAFLAGFFPARRAAGLEPVRALKLF